MSDEQTDTLVDSTLRNISWQPALTISGEAPRKKKERAHLTQYTKTGNSFIAAGDTVAALDAGCYKLEVTQRGLAFVKQAIVTDNLLRLPDSKSDEVVKEIDEFWGLKDIFKEFGFTHKRGFLLHGSPGCGKTSTLSIVTEDMIKRGGVVFLANQPEILTFALGDFRAVEPNRPLVVIMEDLDALIKHWGESQLLAVLDGEYQVDNVVFLATSNYPELLDSRLTNRPSRFDKIVRIDMPNDAAREMYIKSKLNTTTAKDGTNLVEVTKGFSIAHIKELIVSVYCQGNDVKSTLERLKKMKVSPKSGESGLNQMGL